LSQQENPPPEPPSGEPNGPTAPKNTAPAQNGTAATVLAKNKVQSVLGKNVRSTDGADMGRIVDVIVDRKGEPRAAVIDFGGFLGVGSRKIAVDWSALHFSPDGQPSQITLALTKDQVKAAPAYAGDKQPVVVLSASGKTQPIPSEDLPADSNKE
jgi:hypothetical protein